MTIIQVYAPTEKAEEEEMIKFYDNLEETFNNQKTELMYVIGDFNARLGKRLNEEENSVLGPHGYGLRNERGERLIKWLEEMNLKFGNSFFKKKDSRKWTWISPNRKTKNEIDLILTNKIETIQDITALNNVNFDSDHRLVRMKIKINHKTLRRNRQIYYIPKIIPEQKLINYNETIKTKINQLLEPSNNDLQNTYDKLENIIKTTAKISITNIKTSKEKISDETKALISRREHLRTKTQLLNQEKTELSELRKTIKSKITNDIRAYNEKIIKDTLRQTKSINKAKRYLNNKQEWIVNMKDQNAVNITNRRDINENATLFFEKLFTSTKINTEEETIENNDSISTQTHIFSKETIERTIDDLKRDKCTGNDGISAEMLIYAKNSLSNILTNIFNEIVLTKQIPEQWKETTITLIHKKGNKDDINNYRPISNISTIYKLFSKALYRTIKDDFNNKQPREQAGFREGFSTTDHLQTMNQLIEKCNEFKQPVYFLFIDFSKAFDSVEHEMIWSALRNQNINPDLIETVKNIYKNNTARIKTEKIGRKFNITRGVRQGDPLSPPLFNAVLEDIFQKINWKNYGITICGQVLNNLRFADDIVLISTKSLHIQEMLTELTSLCRNYGLQINKSKTKVMTNHTKDDITLDREKIEYVEDYIYLGQIKSFKDQENKEINRRITNSWRQFWSLKEILQLDQSADTRKNIFDSAILPILTYGLQTMSLTTKTLDQLRICQTKMERKILNIRPRDRIRNEDIRTRTGIIDVINRTRRLKWSWAGHLSRLPDQRWTKLTTKWKPDNKRPAGRPNKRWSDDLSHITTNWYNEAKNRDTWAALGEAYANIRPT